MQIQIDKLQARTIIGVYDYEKEIEQNIEISARIDIDGSVAALSDDITDTLDYQKLCDEIIAVIEGNKFSLVEYAVNKVLDIIMAHDIVTTAEVEIYKPAALARYGGLVSVKDSRTRQKRNSSVLIQMNIAEW